MRKINLKDFEAAGVCSDGFTHFRAAFGDEIEVTEENCRLMAGKLNFNWGAKTFLNMWQFGSYLKAVGPGADLASAFMAESKKQFDADLDAASQGTNYATELRLAIQTREAREAPVRREHEILQAVEFGKAYNL